MKGQRREGFTLIELMLALGILLIVVAFVLSAFTNGLKSMRWERGLASRDSDLTRTIDLITTELGQAGVTPNIIDPTNPSFDAVRLAGGVSAGGTQLSLQNGVSDPIRGLYPGRPFTLGLPEGSAGSENLTISQVNIGCGTTPCVLTTTGAVTNHPGNDYFSSPMLPNMFGILNPPPLTAGTPPVLPLTALTKTVNRIGFVGGVLGDGNYYYVEYSYDASSKILYRSMTRIDSATKAEAFSLLNNVTSASFTIIYPGTNNPIPVGVDISIKATSKVPDPQIAGGTARFIEVSATTRVMPRGTAAAAMLWDSGVENQLRSMMPPCGSTRAFAPCDLWNTAPWQWWQNVYNFTATAPVTGFTPAALP